MDQPDQPDRPDRPLRHRPADAPEGMAGGPGAAGGAAGAAVPQRRRGKALEAAIFEAALDQLTSGGFARMTMEGVAGAAQTGKAALYRRWNSKGDLVVDALAAALPPVTDVPDLGSVRAELWHVIEAYVRVVDSPIGAAVHALMGELDQERADSFKGFLQDRVIAPTTEVVLGILRRGEARGDVRPGAAVPAVADVLPAMLLYRAKLCGGVVDEAFGVDLLELVLLPMVRP
ncbi:TetR/AcrR family transcriptional regulator [Kitasatospora sp. NA04385]|uniref:TetR/AcrR family transcriptional regulator n=1 Tax=Kitasatospora sp. NA04385 TaxID=2742135 RepID=UPI0015913FC1|nr:TetR/AcrR family transcriptional regulator [Kitasatospora sp. NA04385]QKW21884.1 TetR/AcrR family transcriptional regulator [Kitasatospora sp. NA04385]